MVKKIAIFLPIDINFNLLNSSKLKFSGLLTCFYQHIQYFKLSQQLVSSFKVKNYKKSDIYDFKLPLTLFLAKTEHEN